MSTIDTDTGPPDLDVFRGITELDGDLIFGGNNRTAVRVHEDGTVVWRLDRSSEGGGYLSCVYTPSGVWFTTSENTADLVTAAGSFVSLLDLSAADEEPWVVWSDVR